MSPELIAPERFGFRNSRPTIPSDCYALGMVIYETISGNMPFHEDTDLTVFMKVMEGKRPPRGRGFTESLWRVLKMCWAPQPGDRPGINDGLQCLETISSLPEALSPGSDEEMEGDGDSDGWDSGSDSSGVLNEANDTTMTGWSTTTPSGLSYSTNTPFGPALTASGVVGVVNGAEGSGPKR